MTEEKLRPCPFCGLVHEWEEILDLHWGKCWSICCGRRILLSAYTEEQKVELTKFWNSRPMEDTVQFALQDMLELIEEHGSKTMKAHASRILKARAVLSWKASYDFGITDPDWKVRIE